MGWNQEIPRDEVDPVRLERLLRLFRLENAVSGGGMTDEEADLMAEEMKAKRWAENRHRFLPTEPSSRASTLEEK